MGRGLPALHNFSATVFLFFYWPSISSLVILITFVNTYTGLDCHLQSDISAFLRNTCILQMSELSADLSEEHTTSSHATEILEQETADRIRLEKEVRDMQVSWAQFLLRF